MVGSGTTKARAISGVERPPSRRSVSATCAAGASAGWQHVNIEPEAVVLHGGFLFDVVGRDKERGGLGLAVLPGRLPPEAVEDPAARRGDDPPRGARGQAVLGPPHRGDGEGVLHPVLGQVDVAEGPDRGPRPPGRTPGGRCARSRVAPARLAPSGINTGGSSWKGRTSTGSMQAWVAFLAQASAASRSAASMTQNPPMCSLDSVKGPSVIRNPPPSVADHGGGRRRQEPAAEDPGARRPAVSSLSRAVCS